MGNAVVTGSASGIGAAVRERLEKQGDRVVGVDLRDAEVIADLSQPEGRRAALEGALDACGGRLDRAVLAAGLGAHVDDLTRVASVNYFGAVEVLDGLRPALAGRSGASVVVVCSNSAQMGPFQEHPYVLALLEHDEARAHELLRGENGFIAYGGSKHALSRAVRRRSPEWGRAGIRLNGIAPGPTRTPLMEGAVAHPIFGRGVAALSLPLGRWAEPAEIAAVVAFLLGPEAGYVHGSIVYADGGNDAELRPDAF
jgi:NAD(P)-dependent dehydrogenase (short-subunit alcohol dehydrogenase family)